MLMAAYDIPHDLLRSKMSRLPDLVKELRLAEWRDPTARVNRADLMALMIAFVLPWSTSLVAIFGVAWLVAVIPMLEAKPFIESLRRPACALPIALFALAVAGMLWADAPWGARFYAVGPTVKLLLLPLIFYHFERSTRGMWVFYVFLISCILLMLMSWIVAFDPYLALKSDAFYGVPVKNYIDQSQEFALCALALIFPMVSHLKSGELSKAMGFAVVSISFFANMMFVVVSRTALVSMPILVVMFALLHLKWRGLMAAICALGLIAGAVFLMSPLVRTKTSSFWSEYTRYEASNEATSIGMRLEFWRKSLKFVEEAPLMGHGTGTTRSLFEQAATGHTGAEAEVVGNPHNQTLIVAIQWGATGVVVLYAMWLSHLLLFREEGFVTWIGLLVIVQNILGSLFNSHLFDFNEGWIYVVGVGVAGGMALGAKPKLRTAAKP
jgi:O-antigen ligase